MHSQNIKHWRKFATLDHAMSLVRNITLKVKVLRFLHVQMNVELALVLLIMRMTVSELWLGASAHPTPQDIGTFLAVPLLSDPAMNSEGCKAPNSTRQFTKSIVTLSQSRKQDMRTATQLYLRPNRCKECDKCKFVMLTPVISDYLYQENFEHSQDTRKSWYTLCEQKIFGLNFRIIDDPTISAVYVSLAPGFQRVLAVYPHPTPRLNSTTTSTAHVYHIVHGRRGGSSFGGLVIQNPYNTSSDVTVQLTGRAKGWKNLKELVEIGENLSMGCWEVLWIEPELVNVTIAGKKFPDLSGTVVSSDTPLSVFTNSVTTGFKNKTLEFDYDSMLRQQMPERARWGTAFFVDGTHSEILPEGIKNCLEYEITIVSYVSDNKITVEDSTGPPTLLTTPTRVVSEEHFEYTLNYNQAQMVTRGGMEIRSTHPILVLSTTYSSPHFTSCSDTYEVSSLVQPREWYANKQLVVLVHPEKSRPTTYNYHVGIVVPANASNLSDILESKTGGYCNSRSLEEMEREGKARQVRTHPVGDGREYTLITYEMSVSSMVNADQILTKHLLRHSDPHIRMGVTVYAYSEHSHYSYSNGYLLGADFIQEEEGLCDPEPDKVTAPRPHVPETRTLVVSLGCAFGLAIPALAMSLIAISLRVRRNRRKRKRRQEGSVVPYDLLSTPDADYPYDIFILCGDRDEEFVKECIELPLQECGYTTFRKNTAPDGLFMPGNAVVANMEHVVKLCSRVIVVCSENYIGRGGGEGVGDPSTANGHYSVEVNCCKDAMSSHHCRVVPVILDGVDAAEFSEFTQHRIKGSDILSRPEARRTFIKKLERDLNIKR